MGGLKKIGTWGLKEVDDDSDSEEEQKGLLRLIKEELKSAEKVTTKQQLHFTNQSIQSSKTNSIVQSIQLNFPQNAAGVARRPPKTAVQVH
ncbi:hypothetical protein P8452_62775 [Trifolium repens]|nr:hypothetical protein P8452_62775 [Trifolium repens]